MSDDPRDDDDALRFERDGGVVTLTLNRPALRNPLTDEALLDGLHAALRRIEADRSVRCVILTGAGKSFSAGGNLQQMRERSGGFAGDATAIREHYRAGIQRLVLALYHLEVPTLAAVNGAAYGAGCDFTCACDLRIASTQATFAENFVKVGLISGDGGGWLLPRAIGLARAAEMSFTGEPIDAATALAWGLVSRVVPPEALMPTARELAARIAANPGAQLRMTKRLLREGQRPAGFEALLELAAAYQGACHQTPAHAEALEAFFAKRPPRFSPED